MVSVDVKHQCLLLLSSGVSLYLTTNISWEGGLGGGGSLSTLIFYSFCRFAPPEVSTKPANSIAALQLVEKQNALHHLIANSETLKENQPAVSADRRRCGEEWGFCGSVCWRGHRAPGTNGPCRHDREVPPCAAECSQRLSSRSRSGPGELSPEPEKRKSQTHIKLLSGSPHSHLFRDYRSLESLLNSDEKRMRLNWFLRLKHKVTEILLTTPSSLSILCVCVCVWERERERERERVCVCVWR